MKSILIIGMGRFGRHCARKLNEMGHQVMAVDKDESCIDEVLSYVTDGVIGDSKQKSFMRTLGVKNFDVCIVAMISRVPWRQRLCSRTLAHRS